MTDTTTAEWVSLEDAAQRMGLSVAGVQYRVNRFSIPVRYLVRGKKLVYWPMLQAFPRQTDERGGRPHKGRDFRSLYQQAISPEVQSGLDQLPKLLDDLSSGKSE